MQSYVAPLHATKDQAAAEVEAQRQKWRKNCESEAEVTAMERRVRTELDVHYAECFRFLQKSKCENVERFRSIFTGMTAWDFQDFHADSLEQKSCAMDIEGTKLCLSCRLQAETARLAF